MEQIRVNNVSFSYNNEKIISDLTLNIFQGDFVCILGESGCGKSTFLRLLAGLNFPDTGEILIDDVSVKGPGLDRGVVFQDYSLYPWMTTGKNILLSMKQRYPYKPTSELKEKIMFFLKQVGLEESVYDKYPNELSGGMRQRCAICRAFALDSPVLLMDEPFGALDAVTRFRLQDLVRDMWLHSKDKTLVFVTHDVEEAMYLSTKIYVMGMKPSRVIYSYDFSDKERLLERKSMFSDQEYVQLRDNLINVLNNDIEARTRRNETKSTNDVVGM